MAYSIPRTWSTGETVTASLFNIGIRDNLNALHTRQMAASVGMSAGINPLNATWTVGVWDVVDVDTHGFFDGSQGLVIPEAGRYVVGVHGMWVSNTSGDRRVYIDVNLAAATPVNANTLGNHRIVASRDGFARQQVIVPANTYAVGDVLRVKLYQNSGGTRSAFNRATYGPRAGAFWIYRANDN